MTAQLPSRVYRIGNPENDDHCFTDNSKSAADAIKNGYEVSEYILAAHEQDPVGVVRYVCAGLERPGIHVSLYDTSLPDGTELFTRPALSPAYGDEYQGAREDLAIWKRRALEAEEKLRQQPAPVPAVSTREKLAALQLASIINDLGLPENAPFVEITSEIFRLKQLESPAPAVPDIDTWRTAFEYSERQRDEGFNLHKFGTGYADDATQKRWESWLSSRAAMLNGGKS